MTKVFLGGSRRISRLNVQLRMRLDRIIEKGLPVIVGDANGADKAFQQYLCDKSYRNVEVFCSGNICRNNLGNWKQREVPVASRNRTYAFYARKDRAMACEAAVGFMLWDGKSTGTLLNVLRLLGQQKKTVLYNAAEQRFHELKEFAQWEEFISKCDGELRKKIEQRATLEAHEHDTPQQSLIPRRGARPADNAVC
ncbi:MAG: hypothetical protein WAW37_14335 [Syntrophobacteraceae bacterium]